MEPFCTSCVFVCALTCVCCELGLDLVAVVVCFIYKAGRKPFSVSCSYTCFGQVAPALELTSCSFWPGRAMAEDTKFLLLLLLLNSSTLCFSTKHDIQCLKSVQQSVIDPLGVLKSSWNFGYATDGYICSFTGVECWHGYENKVLSLRLDNLGLEGPFPQGLQNCTSLNILDLLYNNFSAPIPSGI